MEREELRKRFESWYEINKNVSFECGGISCSECTDFLKVPETRCPMTASADNKRQLVWEALNPINDKPITPEMIEMIRDWIGLSEKAKTGRCPFGYAETAPHYVCEKIFGYTSIQTRNYRKCPCAFLPYHVVVGTAKEVVAHPEKWIAKKSATDEEIVAKFLGVELKEGSFSIRHPNKDYFYHLRVFSDYNYSHPVFSDWLRGKLLEKGYICVVDDWYDVNEEQQAYCTIYDNEVEIVAERQHKDRNLVVWLAVVELAKQLIM